MEIGLAAPKLGVAGTRSLGTMDKISTTTPEKILVMTRIMQAQKTGDGW